MFRKQTFEEGYYKIKIIIIIWSPFHEIRLLLKGHTLAEPPKKNKNKCKETVACQNVCSSANSTHSYCRLLWTRHCLRMQLPRTTTHKFKSSQQFRSPVWNSDIVILCHIIIIITSPSSSSSLSLANFMPRRCSSSLWLGKYSTNHESK